MVEEVKDCLCSLDCSRATGTDGISAKLLKEAADVIAPSLYLLFNWSLSSGTIPKDYKLANIVPVLKKGDCQQVENYPPISLLPTVSKGQERCILNIIKTHLYNRVSKHQHGFLKGKSCSTNLIKTLDRFGRLLDRGSQINVIYLAMSKAFDKVKHAQLLFQLHIFGFGGKLFHLDLNNVGSWSTESGLEFSETKSHHQSITCKTKPLNTA